MPLFLFDNHVVFKCFDMFSFVEKYIFKVEKLALLNLHKSYV